MKNTHQVYWAAVAQTDLAAILAFVADESLHNALEILAKIREKAAAMTHTPQRGRVVPELLNQGISHYREIIVAPWRVIYRVEENRVFVVSVVDSRRNVEDVLLGRFLR